MKTEDGLVLDERTHDTPGRRALNMEQHTSIDHVTNGPKKGLIAIIGLLVTIAGLLGAVLNQTYRLGAWVATHEAAQRAALSATTANSRAIAKNAEAIKELTETVGVIATQDTVRGQKLESVERELRSHRRASEQ